MIPLLFIFAATFTPAIGVDYQPAPPAVERTELDSAELLRRLRDAYRAGPVADRVEMSVAALGGPAAKAQGIRSVVTARLNPTAKEPSMKLELSDLLVFAQGQQLIGINRLEQRTAAVVPLSSLTIDALAEHLPPIPLPQVALAFGKDDTEFFRRIGPVKWGTPVRVAAGAAIVYTISGTHAAGTIDLKIDGVTFRLMQVTAMFAREAGKTQLTLDITAVDPGDPDGWKIDITGRDKVQTFSQLRQRMGEIKNGDKLPNLTANSAGFEAWSIVDVFSEDRKKTAPGARPADAMVLILFRATEDRVKSEAVLKDAQAGQQAAAKVLSLLRRQRVDDPAAPSVLCESIAVFELQKFERERPNALVKTWAESHPDLPAKSLRWSLSANTTIDRVSPSANAVVVVILPDLTLGGIVSLDGRSADADAIATDTINIIHAAVKKP